LNIVEFINSKNNFMQSANKLGIDVPMTLCFDAKSSISVDDLKDVTYPCYLKAAVSVSGAGIYRCTNRTELFENFRKFDSNTPLQIQEEVITNTFLNLQYKVVGKEAIRLAASEQILNGFVHQGNRVPATHEPWHIVDSMAEWLVEQGMKGIFAFDVAIAQTTSGLRFPAIECNPRFNGATYPTLVAQKLGITEWSALNFSTKYRSLDKIDLKDIEYDSRTGEGAVLINWGTVLEGKLVILMAGSYAYQEALKLELEARL
jgi:carbamoylphosphate synthase large subunit